MAKRVVVIDDEVDFANLLKIQLEKKKFLVFVANSGAEGLELVKKEIPDIVLLDIMMPKMSGWQVCSKIKSDSKTKDIPVLFLTARTDDISRSMGLKGADGYIEKPFDPIILIKKINELIK